jgi:L-alanine-DL-glutamate epimerase-like enolase superfamily enzyme
MVKITGIRTATLRWKTEPPYACATGVFAERGTLLVFIETDRGLTGLGECYAGGSSYAPLVSTAVEKQLAPMLIGEDPLRIEHLWQKMYWRSFRHGRKGALMNAISGIDIALWDLFGKSVDMPVYRLLGACHDQMPAYASAGFYIDGQGPQQLAESCAGYVAKGFRAVKIKVARHGSIHPQRASWDDRLMYRARPDEMRVTSWHDDVERVEAVRAAIGKHVGLAVDANCAWDPATVIRFCRAVESSNLLWIEEPVATDNVRASAELARELAVPIAGYETETGLHAWRTLFEQGAVDIAQPGIGYVGGFSEFRRIAAVAEAFKITVAPHSYSSAVALAASVHAACALPNATIIEYDQHPNPLLTDLLEEPLLVNGEGYIRPPEGPGLGIRVRTEALEKYAARA